jgi:hypothetical protein
VKRQKAADLDFKIYFPLLVGSKREKTRDILTRATAKVTERCDAYDGQLAEFKVPETIAWNRRTHNALLSCYIVGTKALSTFKDSILDGLAKEGAVNLLRCPYCMLNDPRTWDHYLPKESFPEFSVYHSNLVYICFGCNQRKLAHFDPEGLIFCHPYFTASDTDALLHCRITIASGNLSIQYYGAGEGELATAGRVVQAHIERLRLNDRLSAEAASLIGVLIGELRHHHPDGASAESLQRILSRKYAEAREELGVNAWDSRLWHGLNACTDFPAYANDRLREAGNPSAVGFNLPAPLPPP